MVGNPFIIHSTLQTKNINTESSKKGIIHKSFSFINIPKHKVYTYT